MLKKILIANRGEIACRVIKSARKMGIKTVAIYSDADANALHVQMADEAVHIGPSPSNQSYLVIDNIIAAIKETGADAVHPGYGFLSENRIFCERLKEEGITFIGPDAHAIEAMGDKIASKKLAEDAGVSVVPGFPDAITDPEVAVSLAEKIGYPVMLKASAGGGGKGMRLAYTPDEVRTGLVAAMNEGRNAFGDDRVFVEKFIEKPRHIEIQILADRHGTCLYLGERECSIQRRHQKVLEEAPSPFMDPETRKAMGEQAVALARAVDYVSAGTVEFIMDQNKNFYFLEMNTRLQVEHPVTEFITGIDLVESMIRVANGEALGISQDDIHLNGWALEARIYAEDPERGFLPSTGRLERFQPPSESEGAVRIDTGVEEGAEISIYYDPMVAKLITYGKNREASLDRMAIALDQFEMRGISHNIGFLSQLVAHGDFRSGDISTNFIGDYFPNGLEDNHLIPEDRSEMAMMGALVTLLNDFEDASLSDRALPLGPMGKESYSIFLGDKDREEIGLTIEPSAHSGIYNVQLEGSDKVICIETGWQPGNRCVEAMIDGQLRVYQVSRFRAGFILSHGGYRMPILAVSPQRANMVRLMPYKAPPDRSKMLLSPMPGLLVRLTVRVGDQVKAGSELAVIEAMKMENVMKAEADVTVKTIKAEVGDSLAVDQVIIEFE